MSELTDRLRAAAKIFDPKDTFAFDGAQHSIKETLEEAAWTIDYLIEHGVETYMNTYVYTGREQ